MSGDGVEFSLRVEFFDDMEKADLPFAESGYAGSMILDGVTGVCVPRVGENIHWLNQWMPPGFDSRVYMVEHRLGGFASPTEWEKVGPDVTVVIRAKRPLSDEPMDQAVTDFEAQGWTWHPPRGMEALEEAKLD